MRAVAALFVLIAALLTAAPASAHTRSETHSSWIITGGEVRVIFTVPDAQAARLVAEGSQISEQALGAYLAARVYPMVEGKACKRTSGPIKEAAQPGFHRFELGFACEAGHPISIHSGAFYAEIPSHVNFAQIEKDDGTFIEQLLVKDQQTLDPSGGGEHGDLKSASFFDYMGMGIMHIFTGVDHMLFLVGLTMISRRLKDLTFVVTGFTIGHSLTLALAITGLVRPHGEYIDALVALTIVLIGAENLSVENHKPGPLALGLAGLLVLMTLAGILGLGGMPPALMLGAALFAACYLMISGHLRDAGRVRLIVALVFGLIHGFGFAANLMEMQLPKQRLAELLVGFNLGVEVGQLSLVLLLSGVVWLLAKRGWTLPRPIVVDVVAAFLVAIGLYWFLGRAYL